jgi:hypothetical protein
VFLIPFIKGINYEDRRWIKSVHDLVQRQALVSAVSNIWSLLPQF